MPIYLNACSHGLSDPAVAGRILAYLEREAEIGEVRATAEAESELAGIRADAAALIGADEGRTGLSSSTTVPWEALVLRIGLSGKRVLVAAHEWFSNVHALRALGALIDIVPASEAMDPAAWRARIDDDLAAIFAPMVSSVSGIRYPVEAIGALDRPEDCLFIVDAAQALGQVPVDVSAIGCDALVGTTRKWLRGPCGTGLYWLGCRAQAATGLRAGLSGLNPALILGLGQALRLVGQGVVPTGKLREGVRALGMEPLSTDTGAVTVRIGHDRADAMREAMKRADCIVKWPDPVADEPLSAVTLEEGALLRLSPHAYNTGAELDIALAALATGLGQKHHP